MAVVAGGGAGILVLLACKSAPSHEGDVLVDVPPEVSSLVDEQLTTLGVFTKIDGDVELIGLLCESDADTVRFSNARESDDRCVEPVDVSAFVIPGVSGDTEDNDSYNDLIPCGTVDPASPWNADIADAVARADGQLFAGFDEKDACKSSTEALVLELQRIED